MKNKATTQGVSPLTGFAPPADHQFGAIHGNPQGRGVNKEKLAARRDLQKQLDEVIHMTHEELDVLIADDTQPQMIKTFATAVKVGNLESALNLWHEVFGKPAQKIFQENSGTQTQVIVYRPEKNKMPDDVIGPNTITHSNYE